LRESPQESRLLSNTKEERQHTLAIKQRRGEIGLRMPGKGKETYKKEKRQNTRRREKEQREYKPGGRT